jgi:hypothetical protein
MIIAVRTSNFRINIIFLKERPFIDLLKRLTRINYRAIQIFRLRQSRRHVEVSKLPSRSDCLIPKDRSVRNYWLEGWVRLGLNVMDSIPRIELRLSSFCPARFCLSYPELQCNKYFYVSILTFQCRRLFESSTG